ncbi:putative PilZ domain-containing protein [Gammaproteobacteria bacterium]
MERRAYFRVRDQVRLRVSALTKEECQECLLTLGRSSHLATSLTPLRLRFNQTLRNLAVESAEVAEGLKLLDEKIEILARWLDGGQDLDEAPMRWVDLSACGLACDVAVAFVPQSCLEIRLVLLPSLRLIRAVARVVLCDPLPDQGYRLRISFLGLAEADREFLIRHVLQRQGEWLRNQPKSLREETVESPDPCP